MKKYHVFSLAAFAMLLLYPTSCTKEPVPKETPDLSEGPTLLEIFRSEGEEHCKETMFGLEDTLVETKHRLTRTPTCNCSYRIIDFQYESFDEKTKVDYPVLMAKPPVEVILWSKAKCNSGGLPGCNLFTGIYTSGPLRLPEESIACFDLWKTLPPREIFDFNCRVPAFSSFPVTFATPAQKLESWTITFQIYCQDSRPMLGCDQDKGNGYVSEPITLSYPGNALTSNSAEAFVKLTGCGCVPEEVWFY